MNFNQAIPILDRPKFSEGSALISSRDNRNNSHLWKKGKSMLNQSVGDGQALQKISREVSKLKRRIVGGQVPIKQSQLSHPFKIYQPSNFASFSQGVTFLGTDGTPTVCNIGNSVPTDFTATPPTVNPTTDAWRFWTVRSGMIDYRPIYNWKNLVGFPSFGISSPFGQDAENWVWKWPMTGVSGNFVAPDYTDAVVPFDSPSLNMNLIADGGTSQKTFPIIIPDISGIDSSVFGFSIWVKFIQETAPPDNGSWSFTIQAAKYDTAPNFASGFPDSNFFIVPIGILNFQGNVLTPQTFQYIFDNIKGRYPNQAQGNFSGGGSVFNIRGSYNTDEDSPLPDDLKSQIFYNGDCIRITNDSGGNSIYQFFNNKPYSWEDPTSSSRWQQIF